MSIQELLSGGGGLLLLTMTIVQISPLQLNPWKTVAKIIGKAINQEVMDKLDEQEANASRYHILRFDDEIRHRVKHTEEHFNQIVSDIDKYEAYCKQHPEYPNNKAQSAIAQIKKTYQKCKDENAFL